VSNIKFLLEKFGQATGLSTNFQKSEVFPIRCDTLNISRILGDFEVRQCQLPCKYLGLPLRLGHIRREDEQILIDRVAGKLPKWKGKLLNRSGRLTLINSVLSSIVLCHMTVFTLSSGPSRRSTKYVGISYGRDQRTSGVITALSIGREFNAQRS
jgi:hypothetical protein